MSENVCGAKHPTPEVNVTCALDPGPNAVTDEGVEVHVCKGQNDEGVYRWEIDR